MSLPAHDDVKFPDADNLISPQTLAKRWDVPPKTVYELNLQGLPRRKVGRRVRYDYAEATAWLQRRGDQPAAVSL